MPRHSMNREKGNGMDYRIRSFKRRTLNRADGYATKLERLMVIFTVCCTIACVLFGGSTSAVAFGVFVLVTIKVVRRLLRR